MCIRDSSQASSLSRGTFATFEGTHTDHTLKLPLYLEGTFAAFGGTAQITLKLPLYLEGTFAAFRAGMRTRLDF